LTAVAVTACGSGQKPATAPPERPSTSARIQILSPTPNQTTGPDVAVQVNLIGAREVQPVTGKVKPDEGHIHVALDGVVVAMAYGDTQQLKGLAPGPHSVQVDFVAIDHVPFKNRVTAAVLFTVQK
ncbi:MAG: hypothetical protein ACREI3_04630, partial [Nitrospirales bacterium]